MKLILAQWLKPIILATWDVETRRITVRDQPGQKVQERLWFQTLSQDVTWRLE
jgi:hypothetical protein